MTNDLPSVTVLIAARPDLTDIKAVAGARQLDYPHHKLEIIVARGRQPSVQRNDGMKAAHGEIIYFLDDDSIPQAQNLRKVAAHFRDSTVTIVGGPNVCPPDAPQLEQIFALVLSSWLAFGPSRARYAPVGRVRETGEKELILCNMAARRAAMLELGGFNEALYPNEENALMDELVKRGERLLYDPELVVLRRPRRTLKSFCRMLMSYGRGRAEQFREHPTFGSAPNFVPPLFCAYLLSLPFLPRIGFIPLILYAAGLAAQVVALIPLGGLIRSLCAVPVIVLTHILYGLGFWRGLFTILNGVRERESASVTLEKLSF